MPSYAKGYSDGLLFGKDDILVAEMNGVVRGAISVGFKEILCLSGRWRNGFEQQLDTVTTHLSGGWISKLYVFPEYRYQGLGTLLVKKAMEHLEKKGIVDTYAGVYVKNEFRKLSKDIFRKNGFKKYGYCICPLADGFCRGELLRNIASTKKETAQ